MQTKTFDCVEMKRRGGEKIYEQLKDKLVEEQVVFWQQKDEEFQEFPQLRRDRHRAG